MSTLLDHPVPTLPPPQKRPGARRLRPPQWSSRTYRIIGLIVGLLFAFGLWLFYFSSVFALNSLVVEGVRTVDPKEVGIAADLGAGTPLARVNAQDVQARITTIPAVGSVEVIRRWPDTVVIRVVERDPVAAIAEGERFATVDATGFTFATTKKQPGGLPLLEAAEGSALMASVGVAAGMPSDLLKKIATIDAVDPNSIVLTTKDGVTVMWGKSEDNVLKGQILAALLKKTDDNWIDLRLPSTPTSAAASPKPAPPPSTEPTPTSGAVDAQGNPIGGDAGAEIPVVPGLVPESIEPVPVDPN